MEAAAGRLNEILVQEPAKRLSMGDTYATPVGRMSGLSALAACLSRGSPLAQHRAAAAFRNALLAEENDAKLLEADVIVLCAAVVMGTPPTQANAAAALGNVCCSSGNGRNFVLATGGVGALAALILSCTRFGGAEKLAQSAIPEAAAAVRNACFNHKGNRDEVMRARAVGAFVDVLRDHSHVPQSLRERHATMLEHVLGALRNACNQHNGNCMQLAEAEGVGAAVELLVHRHHVTQGVLGQAVGLIRNACVGRAPAPPAAPGPGGGWGEGCAHGG